MIKIFFRYYYSINSLSNKQIVYRIFKTPRRYISFIKLHLNKIYSMPIFYIIMTILGYLIINKFKKVKSKFFVILSGIFISVIVYYLNYFSGILGDKGALPIYLSVWTPLIILLLICSMGLLRVDEN